MCVLSITSKDIFKIKCLYDFHIYIIYNKTLTDYTLNNFNLLTHFVYRNFDTPDTGMEE